MGGVAGGPAPDATINEIVKLKDIDATALADVLDGGGSGTIYGVEIDCTANTTEDVYLKFADALTATPGTTTPYMKLIGKASKKTTYMFPNGIAFATGVTAWCTQEKTIAGTTSPSGTVNVTMIAG
jgi:hypothetical protein